MVDMALTVDIIKCYAIVKPLSSLVSEKAQAALYKRSSEHFIQYAIT